MKTRTRVTLSIALILALSGCGELGYDDKPREPDPTCAADVAMIVVQDGYLQAACGCQNLTDGQVFHAGSELSCTVSSGTKVLFHYVGTKLNHQIVSTGALGFTSSPPHLPAGPTPANVWGVELTTTGTYTFQDQFSPLLSGRIVVQ